FIRDLKIIGAQRRIDQQQIAPQNSVFVQVGNTLQPFENFLLQALNTLIIFFASRGIQTRIKLGFKQRNQVTSNGQLIQQGVGNVTLSKIKQRLMHII